MKLEFISTDFYAEEILGLDKNICEDIKIFKVITTKNVSIFL